MSFILKPGDLRFEDLRHLSNEETTLSLETYTITNINQSADWISQKIKSDTAMYGVNTGFGKLANTKIDRADLEDLQRKIILSHAAGVGDYLSDDIVRMIMLLKINSLARGYSGVRLETIEILVKLFNAKIYPCIPSKGSVGASGDLAPLAHLACVLIGKGFARVNNKIISGEEALRLIGVKPLVLAPKEGLALLNGTQVSTALVLVALIALDKYFHAALIAGSLTIDAARGSDQPFDPRIHEIRGQRGQIIVAEIIRKFLQGSEIRSSHQFCPKVQDPYCLRCQPQVMGASLDLIEQVRQTVLIETNGVSDNPLIFAEDDCLLSGGNFHAEPIAFAADQLALAICEIGSLSERRIALLMDPQFSQLPPFLIKESGLNSGFMLTQVTAAALVSENKALAYPASVDSIPTSANQEDHVSMATYAARRLLQMNENLSYIIAIELLAASQGIDLLSPLVTSANLSKYHQIVRNKVPYLAEDRYLADDILAVQTLLKEGAFI